jgi:hypothetical protein
MYNQTRIYRLSFPQNKRDRKRTGDSVLINEMRRKTSFGNLFCGAKLMIFADMNKKSAKKALILQNKA